MPTFSYVATDEKGERLKGRVDARDEAALRKELVRRNYEIKAIKERGGLTLPLGSAHSAPRHDSMPSSAIATGLVDLVVPVEAMAEKQVAYERSFMPTAQLVAGLPGETEAQRAEAARREICALLRVRVGHEFGGYKQ